VSGQNGALRIFLYNWPVFAGTWVVSLVVLGLLHRMPPSIVGVASLAAGTAITWTVVSLVVSVYVYDRSALVSGRWVPPLVGREARTWATIHAGLDAEIELDAVMPGRCVARLDIFDARVMTSPSIQRARARTGSERPATRCSPIALTLESEGCDAIVVAFTAHEIRDQDARERFFDEIHRCLRRGGKALIVEHLRDWANFAAFGPGFLHFVSRREWLRLAGRAGLAIASETRITPWVMALTLERPA
jgi:SAM-dependent methyltransferase